MTKTYSYSKLNAFEQCPLKYKYKYLDKIPPCIEKTIEAHLGDVIHKSLEWLYINVKENKIPSIDELISYYAKEWQKYYNPKILIVKKELTVEDYFNRGVEFLINYYMKHRPFNDNTLETEKKIIINLNKEGGYKIRGFIDRVSYNLKTKEYEIHDYKTSNNIPKQEKIENDKQLALYSIAIKELFGGDKEVCLIWHYLAHDKKILLKKTNEQLEWLKKETLELIKQIESTTKFPAYISKLCDWCEYKDICHAWDNNSEVKVGDK